MGVDGGACGGWEAGESSPNPGRLLKPSPPPRPAVGVGDIGRGIPDGGGPFESALGWYPRLGEKSEAAVAAAATLGRGEHVHWNKSSE